MGRRALVLVGLGLAAGAAAGCAGPAHGEDRPAARAALSPSPTPTPSPARTVSSRTRNPIVPDDPVGLPSPAPKTVARRVEPGPPGVTQDLEAALLDAVRVAQRRRAFGRAVERISTQLGSPISAAQALRDNPCGGWTGPSCSNLTIGLEVAKTCAPLIARWHNKRTAEVTAVLVDAVSAHSVWHDAYGYVREKLHKGPGYTYAGCLFSRCDPDSMYAGQIDGILYQVGRILGVTRGPACGPDCALPAP